MTTDTGCRSIPAEWQISDPAVIMALPHADTDWAYMLDEALECFREMISAISKHAEIILLTPDPDHAAELLFRSGENIDPEKIHIHRICTNDTWTRDYAPITVVDSDGKPRLLDFTFNGWGMKFAACHDNCVNRTLEKDGIFARPLESHKEMVLEGGSIDSDGNGNLLVTSECLLEPNRNPMLNRSEIEKKLIDLFGLRKVLWIDHGFLCGDDTDSHIDTLVRFAPDNKIVYVGCDDPDDTHYSALSLMEKQLEDLTGADGNRFTLVRLPMADPCYEGDFRLPATYANYLVLPDAVIMPSYNSPEKDSMAAELLAGAYNLPVIKVDCRALIRQHGSLHCSTMQLPLSALSLS